jgi:hypothetical protein
MSTTGTIVPFYVQPLSNYYANGLERVELHVSRESKEFVARPASGQRDSVTVCIAGRNYLGGLRTFQGRTYLCPDLVSEIDNQLVKLADLLSDIGIAPKDQIDVLIDAGKWTIPA